MGSSSSRGSFPSAVFPPKNHMKPGKGASQDFTINIYISIYLYLYLYIYIYDAILLIYFQAEARKPLRLKIDFSKPPGGASSPNIQIGWRWLEPP
jgi:hypothetical protein